MGYQENQSDPNRIDVFQLDNDHYTSQTHNWIGEHDFNAIVQIYLSLVQGQIG